MKKFCLVLIFSFLLINLSFAAPAKYISLTPQTTPAVFLPDERIEITVHAPGFPKDVQALLKIKDYRGNVHLTKHWCCGVLEKPQKFPFRSKVFGVFRAILTIRERNGSEIATDETTFARIRDVRLDEPRPDSPFGIGAYYAVRFNPKELAIAAKIQQLLGASWDRDELLWDIVEPEKGKWNWEKTDRTVIAARKHNIHILGLLDYWGKWTDPLTEQGYDDYANYVTKMVERYKPGGVLARKMGWKDGYGIRNWEIWNEPATFWTGSGEQFGKLLDHAYQAAKSADPDCRVFFSEAGKQFNTAVIKTAGLDSFDGVTPHYYCPPRKPEEAGVDQRILDTKDEFEKLGVKDKPFWVSEFGWHSTMDPGQMLNQAVCLVRAHVYGLAGGLDKFFWYNFVNDNRNKNNQHFGLINREDWTPRYGFGAYAAMVHFLEDAEYVTRVKIVKPAKIFIFKKPEASLAVCWSAGAEGSLKFPMPATSEIYDIMGNRRFLEEIPLREDPVYMLARNVPAERLAAGITQAVVKGISAAEMNILPVVGSLENNPPVKVRIENVGRGAVQGKLSLDPPRGWKLKKETISGGPLKPGESEVFSFSFEEMKRNKDNRYQLSATFEDKDGGKAIVEEEVSEMVATKKKISVDGKYNDWKNPRYIHLDNRDKAVGLTPYMDWNLSARVALAWDEKNLYFLGIVKDNNFDQTHTGTLIWEGDSFQLGIDASNAKKPIESGDGQYLYGLAKTSKGEEAWSWPAGKNGKSAPAEKIDFRFSNPEKDIYVYEAAIPKRILEPLTMKAGENFGFTVLLNDNDGGGRRGWLEWTPGIGTGYDPSFYTEWTLVE